MFDDPLIIPFVQYTLITPHRSSKTSYSPLEFTFGMQDVLNANFLKGVIECSPHQKLLQRLVDHSAKI